MDLQILEIATAHTETVKLMKEHCLEAEETPAVSVINSIKPTAELSTSDRKPSLRKNLKAPILIRLKMASEMFKFGINSRLAGTQRHLSGLIKTNIEETAQWRQQSCTRFSNAYYQRRDEITELLPKSTSKTARLYAGQLRK